MEGVGEEVGMGKMGGMYGCRIVWGGVWILVRVKWGGGTAIGRDGGGGGRLGFISPARPVGVNGDASG
jgi:hypothetical protein